jgi:hypothetical protein
VRTERAKNSRKDELGCRIVKPSYGRELFDLQHAKHLPLHIEDVRQNLWLQRSDFAKVIDKSNGWSQIGMSI